MSKGNVWQRHSSMCNITLSIIMLDHLCVSFGCRFFLAADGCSSFCCRHSAKLAFALLSHKQTARSIYPVLIYELNRCAKYACTIHNVSMLCYLRISNILADEWMLRLNMKTKRSVAVCSRRASIFIAFAKVTRSRKSDEN